MKALLENYFGRWLKVRWHKATWRAISSQNVAVLCVLVAGSCGGDGSMALPTVSLIAAILRPLLSVRFSLHSAVLDMLTRPGEGAVSLTAWGLAYKTYSLLSIYEAAHLHWILHSLSTRNCVATSWTNKRQEAYAPERQHALLDSPWLMSEEEKSTACSAPFSPN